MSYLLPIVEYAPVVLDGCSEQDSVTLQNIQNHTGQCKRTGGCYNELVVAFYSTGDGLKGKKIYTC